LDEGKDFSSRLIINSKLKNISLKNNADNFAYRIKLEFENQSLLVYSGDIYDTSNNNLVYKLNDEMILVFENKEEAEIFENMIG
jgi:hypothetical protein